MKYEIQVNYKGAYDVIVVGSGPAGIAAAISSGRNGAKTLGLDRDIGILVALCRRIILLVLISAEYAERLCNTASGHSGSLHRNALRYRHWIVLTYDEHIR